MWIFVWILVWILVWIFCVLCSGVASLSAALLYFTLWAVASWVVVWGCVLMVGQVLVLLGFCAGCFCVLILLYGLFVVWIVV